MPVDVSATQRPQSADRGQCALGAFKDTGKSLRPRQIADHRIGEMRDFRGLPRNPHELR